MHGVYQAKLADPNIVLLGGTSVWPLAGKAAAADQGLLRRNRAKMFLSSA
jgi:hypothetical protein